MSEIKSFSVGLGDMFYIEHNSDNFTIIDCCFEDERQDEILDEIDQIRATKGVTRFISTHPDEDHVRGLQFLDDRIGILNFYCVKNDAAKEEETDSFLRYRELHDSDKVFFISKGCRRLWMNRSNDERKTSGINILWPDRKNEHFQTALNQAANGYTPNNISAVIRYSVEDGPSVLWMGDLESEFMELIEDDLDIPQTDILFAPHHGRSSGKVPETLLAGIDPKVVIIGEADSDDLDYYDGYNTITQNSAGDILIDCQGGRAHFFTSNDFEVDFLGNENQYRAGYHYLGTLVLN